jgi:putative tryptophan/tyrosine transport system substrate-binding protein
MMRRREFIALLGGAATARPLAAQPVARKRHIGAFLFFKEEDSESRAYVAAFEKQLAALGWTIGGNLQIDYRWTGGDPNLVRQYSAELVAASPDVILVAGGSHVAPVQKLTRVVPIVFVQVADAVGGGFVESLARPGGNATGFTNFEFDIAGKWLELLKQMSPPITRVAVLRDAANPSGPGQFGSIQALARSQSVEVRPVGLGDLGEMERGITEFARQPNGGLIILPNGLAIVRRDRVIALAAQYRLPAIYPFRYFVSDGGLMSYGPDVVDQYRRAAGYVDRILKGEKPADLPVEQSTKLTLTINLKAARALGLEVPSTMLATADELIE